MFSLRKRIISGSKIPLLNNLLLISDSVVGQTIQIHVFMAFIDLINVIWSQISCWVIEGFRKLRRIYSFCIHFFTCSPVSFTDCSCISLNESLTKIVTGSAGGLLGIDLSIYFSYFPVVQNVIRGVSGFLKRLICQKWFTSEEQLSFYLQELKI